MSGIVIIEDDAPIRSLLAEWLTAEGYPVRALCPPGGPVCGNADLVIVDVYMPRCMGAERLRSARQSHPGTPVIAISGQFRPGLPGAGSAAEALGVERVIAKPFNRRTLVDAVRSVIGPAR
jgi:CheY-like chemotaxis protein